MKLSLVIPLYNEEESLEQLHQEISAVAAENNYDIEITFVDDGSTDNSWTVIEKLMGEDSRVSGIQFRRNFGKAAALQAGFRTVTGDIVFTLDADLQDDPKEIPDFLRLMQEPATVSPFEPLDVVSGWKQRRHDPWHKVYPSRIFNGMVSFMTGVKLHDHNCGMKCYRREVVSEIALYGERHRFIPVLAAARGYKVGEKVVAHRSRQFGHSKYGFARFAKGFLDLLTVWFLTRYGQRPQHFLGTIGLILFAVGIIGYCCRLSYEICEFVFSLVFFSMDPAVHTIYFPALLPSPYCLTLFMTGLLFIALGFVAELFVARTIQPEKCYVVKKEAG